MFNKEIIEILIFFFRADHIFVLNRVGPTRAPSLIITASTTSPRFTCAERTNQYTRYQSLASSDHHHPRLIQLGPRTSYHHSPQVPAQPIPPNFVTRSNSGLKSKSKNPFVVFSLRPSANTEANTIYYTVRRKKTKAPLVVKTLVSRREVINLRSNSSDYFVSNLKSFGFSRNRRNIRAKTPAVKYQQTAIALQITKILITQLLRKTSIKDRNKTATFVRRKTDSSAIIHRKFAESASDSEFQSFLIELFPSLNQDSSKLTREVRDNYPSSNFENQANEEGQIFDFNEEELEVNEQGLASSNPRVCSPRNDLVAKQNRWWWWFCGFPEIGEPTRHAPARPLL